MDSLFYEEKSKRHVKWDSLKINHITVVVFNNGQWGAEKKNQVLWFGDRYVGTDLDNPSFADIAVAMGANGITCTEIDQVRLRMTR